MYCIYCGNQISDDSVFCRTCGKQLKETIAKYKEKRRCVQCGINLSDDHNNKRCDSCRCDNMDRVKSTGKNIIFGAALVVLASLDTSETDEDDEYAIGKYKCMHCYTDMEYVIHEAKWVCADCGHEVDEWSAYGEYI